MLIEPKGARTLVIVDSIHVGYPIPTVNSLPRLTEQEDSVWTTAVETDTTALVTRKLMPETKDGNAKFILRPNLDRAKNDRGIGRVKPFEKEGVLLSIRDTGDKSSKILEDSEKDHLQLHRKGLLHQAWTHCTLQSNQAK